MNKKSLLNALLSFAIWGILPLYWQLFTGVNSLFLLANRILWSLVFCVILLLCQRRLGEMWRVLKDWRLMKIILPASLFITANWGVYIWAVSSGRVLDASFGYYLNPLVVLLCSVVFFKERCSRLELVAFAFAFAGVAYNTLRYGAVPYVALILSISFALYGTLKKLAHMDPLLGIAVETALTTPLALGYIVYLAIQGAPIYAQVPGELPLLMLAGVLTAVPLILYASGVNGLSFLAVGFMQYISPTLMLVCGLVFMQQHLDLTKIITFVLIAIGLCIYSYELMRKAKHPAVQKL